MPRGKRAITVEDLWKLERLGGLSVSPDGRRAVVGVTRHSMHENTSSSHLWLLATDALAPRALTRAGEKDGAPRFSPSGDRIAFTARREQEGAKDEETQLYLIAPDGGEARRAATIATGVEAFKWFPDGRRIAYVSWVWPELRSARAQAQRLKQWKARKESGYATSEAQYRYWDHQLPMGRRAHLHVLDLDSGRQRDLFEGLGLELARGDPNADAFDVSPDGERIVFAFDPAPEKRIDNLQALAEIELRSGRHRVVAQDARWHFHSPRYAPDGERIAFIASEQGLRHTAPSQLALLERTSGRWSVLSAGWDHDVHAPLLWETPQQLLFTAEDRARQPLWRFHLAERRAEIAVAGGWVQGFDAAAGTLVTVADAMLHPARAHAHRAGTAAPLRLERFNDAQLAGLDLGRVEEREFAGAGAEAVQMWLVYPPRFDASGKKRKAPLLHLIHGGPHAASGDTFHYRWNNAVFAAQGYVCCCVNYHGSSGFGNAFLSSIAQRLGQLELQDVEAATDVLLREPWADPARVFAAGGSYGGYMVAWMNGHLPQGRYAAYVCHAGCFDWTAMFADDAYTWHAKEFGAWYWDEPGKVAAQSPHAFARAMHTPTLVIHGALDYRVPDQQGLAYYNTLKARGIEARLLWFPDENHWVLKPRNSRLWYGEFFDWLARHNPARG